MTPDPTLVATDRVTSTVTRVRDWGLRDPDGVALRDKRYGIWREITRRQYWESVCDVAHTFLALGIEPGDRIAVHSENRPEWLYADLGGAAIRAITVGLYPTNPAAEVRYLLRDSGARVLVAEDQEQVDKALEAGDLPDLERIVYLEPRGMSHYSDPRLQSWEQFVEIGRAHRREHEGALEARMAQVRDDDVATLIYTSGTTGPPKGAMLTVGNIEFATRKLVVEGGFAQPPPTDRDVVLSYLPLCHAGERVFTTWFNAASGCLVNFAESIDTVQADLREIQPTIFLGVPRIWEKMHANVMIRMASASRLKRWNFRLWQAVSGRIAARVAANGGRHTAVSRLLYLVGYLFLYRALRDRLGLRKCRHAASGAAPISPDVLLFFMGIGVPMHEIYAMTENAGVATANQRGRVRVGTVGEVLGGVDVRVADDGEIQTRHAGNFVGYWRQEDASRDTFTDDGWLRTGDVGEWVDGTHLKITGRMKDIIITAGGKNIAPSEVENALKASPYIKEAVVIGDQRRFVSALIGIEYDTVADWAERRGLTYTTYRDLAQKDEVVELIDTTVTETNAKFARVEQVRKFRLLPKELDHEDGELTATQKVKRAAMAAAFEELVESMYASERTER